MPGDGARWQRVQEIVVGAVVADAEDEVRRFLPVREHVPDVDAFVDPSRAHLDDAMALQDLRRGAPEMLPEVVQELVRAPRLRTRAPPRGSARRR